MATIFLGEVPAHVILVPAQCRRARAVSKSERWQGCQQVARGQKDGQDDATRLPPVAAQTSGNRCRGLRPVADRRAWQGVGSACSARAHTHTHTHSSSAIETTSASRAHPAGGRRKLLPVTGNPRKAPTGKPCSRPNPRLSPVSPAAPRPACHAGGHGFESRCSSQRPCKSAYCVVRLDAEIGPTTQTRVRGGRIGSKSTEKPMESHEDKPFSDASRPTAKSAYDYTEWPEVKLQAAVAVAFEPTSAQPPVVGGDPGLFARVGSPDHVCGSREALEILDLHLPLAMSLRQLVEGVTPHPTLERAAGSLISRSARARIGVRRIERLRRVCRWLETRTPTPCRSRRFRVRFCCIRVPESSAAGRRVSSPRSTDNTSWHSSRSARMRPAGCSRAYPRKRGASAGGSSCAMGRRFPATLEEASRSSPRSA
jgi:hypothetical protein